MNISAVRTILVSEEVLSCVLWLKRYPHISRKDPSQRNSCFGPLFECTRDWYPQAHIRGSSRENI